MCHSILGYGYCAYAQMCMHCSSTFNIQCNVSMVFGIWYFSMVFLQHQQKNRQERSFSIPRGQFVACFIGCRAKKQWIKFDKKCKSFKQTPPFYVFQSIFATSAKKQQERLFNIPRRQFVACFVVCRAKSNG